MHVLAGRRPGPDRPTPRRERFERLLALRNDVGLLSEEYDPDTQRLLGNFPQAFSHTALVNTAMLLSGTGQVRGQSISGATDDAGIG